MGRLIEFRLCGGEKSEWQNFSSASHLTRDKTLSYARLHFHSYTSPHPQGTRRFIYYRLEAAYIVTAKLVQKTRQDGGDRYVRFLMSLAPTIVE